jgi:hypothetical protein
MHKHAEGMDEKSPLGQSVSFKPGAANVRTFSCHMPKSLDEIKGSALTVTKSKTRHFRFDLVTFDKGACRAVSKATDVSNTPHSDYVYTLHKHQAPTPEQEPYQEFADLQVQSVASYLAQEFCTLSGVRKPIKFLKSRAIEFLHPTKRTRRFGSLERVLDISDWKKWCSNGRYVLPADDAKYSTTLLAFAHWTWHITDRYLIVVDLQGIKGADNTFILTDPAIHCMNELRFGETNLGENGMIKFFQAHQCNSICRALRLPKHASQTKPDLTPGAHTPWIV